MSPGISTLTRSEGIPLSSLTPAAERGRILLIDPDCELLRIRQYLLTGCSYLVQASCDYREVSGRISIGEPHVAVLNDSLGELALRLVAGDIRQRWPRVKILVVDRRFPALEDHLYDEAVDARFSPRLFLAALDRCYQSSLTASAPTHLHQLL